MKTRAKSKKLWLFVLLAALFVLGGAGGVLFFGAGVKTSPSIIIKAERIRAEKNPEIEFVYEESLPTAPSIESPFGPPEMYGPKQPQTALPETLPKAPEFSPPEVVEGHPKIAIIIDDMGMDHKRSLRTIALPAPITLAFLPYAPNLGKITQDAKNQGHELIIHMPMEPMDSHLSLGSIALREGMDQAQINAQMDKAFAAFDGYVGMNNHMGSRLTQDSQEMIWVMEHLKQKGGLFFVDSKTIGSSVAADVARAYGLETAERDVFLDHQETLDFVRKALRETERVAAQKGYAIAIGHPKDVTIQGLKEWMPEALKRGYVFVPVSELVQKPVPQR